MPRGPARRRCALIWNVRWSFGHRDACRVESLELHSLHEVARFTYWQDGDAWLGYLDDFPDYLTQGEFDDLKAHRLSLYEDLVSGEIPCVEAARQSWKNA